MALTVFIGIVLLYWSTRGSAPREDVTPSVGTGGEQTPGGFKPGPHPSDTQEELERRGAGIPPQGPMPGLTAPVTGLAALQSTNAQALSGRRLEVHDVRVVEARGGEVFWIQQGNVKAAVIPPPEAPAVRVGMRVDVSGVVESDDRGGVRIRAARVSAR